MPKASFPKNADRFSQTDARNFHLLKNANVQLFKTVHYEEQNISYEKC